MVGLRLSVHVRKSQCVNRNWSMGSVVPLLLVTLPIVAQTRTDLLSAADCAETSSKLSPVASYTPSRPISGSLDGEAFKRMYVLDHIRDNREKQPASSASRDLWLDLPQRILDLNPIDCNIQYECTGAVFRPIEVPLTQQPAVAEELRQLEGLPFESCYEVENDFENKQVESRCRFVRSTNWESSRIDGTARQFNIGKKVSKVKS